MSRTAKIVDLQQAQQDRKKRDRPQRVILSAAEWQVRMRQEERERREFEEKRTFELSVEDLRDQTVAIIRQAYGRGESALEKVHANCGPHPATIRLWEDKKVKAPRLNKMRQALVACGHDFKIVPMSGDKRH